MLCNYLDDSLKLYEWFTILSFRDCLPHQHCELLLSLIALFICQRPRFLIMKQALLVYQVPLFLRYHTSIDLDASSIKVNRGLHELVLLRQEGI